MAELVQLRNPKTGTYVVVDREYGLIVEAGLRQPKDGVPFAKRKGARLNEALYEWMKERSGVRGYG